MKVQVVCVFVSFIRSCFCKHVQTTCSSSYDVYKHSLTRTMYSTAQRQLNKHTRATRVRHACDTRATRVRHARDTRATRARHAWDTRALVKLPLGGTVCMHTGMKQLSPVHFPPTPPSFFTSVPSFVVRLYKTRIYTSKVYENFRKTDTIVDLMLPQPVPLCGDIKIEFFHNGWKKVRVSWAAMVAQLVEHSV